MSKLIETENRVRVQELNGEEWKVGKEFEKLKDEFYDNGPKRFQDVWAELSGEKP